MEFFTRSPEFERLLLTFTGFQNTIVEISLRNHIVDKKLDCLLILVFWARSVKIILIMIVRLIVIFILMVGDIWVQLKSFIHLIIFPDNSLIHSNGMVLFVSIFLFSE